MGRLAWKAAPGKQSLLCLFAVLLQVLPLIAQQPTGTIAGVVTDPSGALVQGAKINVLNRMTGYSAVLTTTQSGSYAASALAPGGYQVRVEASGFQPTVLELTVEVGRVARGDVRLQVGAAAEAVTVRADEVRVNSTQSSLDGVVTEKLIRDLPLNGRSFLDLGQLEPGVQLSGDWPVKNGFVRLGFAGMSGVTTRVTVDGVDVGDEQLGSVTSNLSTDAIKEFQVSRSNLDPATGLAGNGSVNVATRSGSNDLHGTGFLFWRDDAVAARIGDEPTPFDREQYGFSLGGPFARDRLFWFANYERNNQDTAVTTSFAEFPQFSGTWLVPYDERMAMGRMDWNATGSLRLFSRFSHHWNDTNDGIGGRQLSPQASSNRTNQIVAGMDSSAGRFTHSVRFAHMNYDSTADIAIGRIPGLPVITDNNGRIVRLVLSSGGSVGPNNNSPVRRYQDTHEVRYDGGVTFGRHALRWGGLVNLIRFNWFAAIHGRAPQIGITVNPTNIAKCGSDLYCYPVQGAGIGNAMGYWTEKPSHGQPYGGIFNDRVHLYLADSWRLRPRLNLNFGLRWVYEPGPNNPDLQKPTKFLDDFLPGLGAPNRVDYNNIAPQVGIAWDPTGSGKWAVRASAGVFYDTNLLKHVIFERHMFLPPGITSENFNLLQRPIRDPFTNAVVFSMTSFVNTNCSSGTFAPSCTLGTPNFLETIWDGVELFRELTAAAAEAFPSGPTRAELIRGTNAAGGLGGVFDPGYSTPYSIHFNVGVQRELRPGLVLSADYVRNRGLRFMMRHDLNRLGAADTLDVGRALAAMNAVHAAVKPAPCPAGPAGVNCAIAANVSFAKYVSAGLGADGNGATLSAPNRSAFPGLDASYNRMELLMMSGISTYDALHVNLRGRLPDLGRYARNTSVVASYALGRLEAIGFEDQALYNLADQNFNDNPRAFRGPANLDRTHMLTVSGLFTAPGGVRLNSIWRAFSALPQSLLVPTRTNQPGEIFYTDLNGDGFSGDPLPGTTRGDYGRRLGCGAAAINRVIDNYNDTQAGRPTPAGRALVDAGLFTTDQLVALGAVSPAVPRAPEGQLCLDSFITTDLRITRPFKLGERFTVEPSLEWFNIFNVANYDLPGSKLSGSLNGTAGTLNGTAEGSSPFRAGGSAGSFALGAPRSWQLSVRVSF